MKISTLTLLVLVILSTSLPALIKSDDNGDLKVECDPKTLQPCLPAITAGTPPSGPCCGKLKEQQTCLCGFSKIPAFAQYISSPNSRKVLAACGVAYPTC